MNACSKNKKESGNVAGGIRMRQIIPALAAVGGACGMAALPAQALELGELTVHSSIGQPLRASIAYALQPEEQLQAYCVSLKSGTTSGGLPALSRARISVSDNVIHVQGQLPIVEPMLGLQLLVDCPYTANLQREYAMFFDFKSATQDTRPLEAETAVLAEDRAPVSGSRKTATSASTKPVESEPVSNPVPAGTRYQVQPGDSLSGIVARIEQRPAGLWPAVEVIFAANPHAFIDGDMNLIKAGSWLDIPDLYAALGNRTPATSPAPVQDPRSSSSSEQGSTAASTALANSAETAYEPFDSGYAGVDEAIDTQIAGDSAPVAPLAAEIDGSAAATRSDELRPGDVILQGDDPFLLPAEDNAASSAGSASSVIIPDTEIPVSSSAASAQPPVEIRSATSGSWSWLAWLGGAGIAIFLGLLLFGRTLRQRLSSTPVGAGLASEHGRRRSDISDRRERAADVDFEFGDAIDESSDVSLDADLGLGTGFRDNADIDVNQDFGFSASEEDSGNFDFEIPAGAADEPEEPSTDIIPPNRRIDDAMCVVESEIPSSDDDEYDLSMIVDATRQPIVDTHLTAKDLKAVPIDSADDSVDVEEYTLSRDVDYKILEQDYQEEFTTTQALNAEIARAAAELADSMGRNDMSDDTAEMPTRAQDDNTAEITSNLPVQSETEITAELTAKLIGQGDAVNDEQISDLDDTGINEELTAELPRADDDATVEMDVEGGRIDTKKKSRAS